VHLSRGEYREGWPLYEARWRVRSLGLTRHYEDRPIWRGGESVEGKTMLLHAEQGYGDTLQFCRYAPLLAARGARVILGVPSALRSLMRTLEGVADVVAQAEQLQFDHHCPLLSVPLAFGTECATIPAPKCYLAPDPVVQARWAARLGPRAGRPRIGLAWSGSATHTNDLNRSMPLGSLLPLTGFSAQFVSLQKDIRAGDTDLLAGESQMLRLGEDLTDFADAAGLVACLDLVISVDTSIAHLAGALGKPVWILLPLVADWRWLQGRQDSPWYRSARLFRQASRGNWADVIKRVAVALDEFNTRAANIKAAKRADVSPKVRAPQGVKRSQAEGRRRDRRH